MVNNRQEGSLVLASRAKEEKQIRVNELHGLKNRHEGHILAQYLEFRLDELAHRTLTCTKDELDKLQGQAIEVRSILKDLRTGGQKLRE